MKVTVDPDAVQLAIVVGSIDTVIEVDELQVEQDGVALEVGAVAVTV